MSLDGTSSLKELIGPRFDEILLSSMCLSPKIFSGSKLINAAGVGDLELLNTGVCAIKYTAFNAVRSHQFSTIPGIIGHGPYSIVFEGRLPGLDRDVAIKMFTCEVGLDFWRGDDMVHLFVNAFSEAKTVANLKHPNLPTVYDLAGCVTLHNMVIPMIVMEKLGESLYSLINKKALDIHAAVKILEPIGLVVDLCHKKRIIHRDIKPANILFAPNETPVLVDFGLHLIHNNKTHFPGAGTEMYMSPEQFYTDDGKDLTEAIDQYSFARTLAEVVCPEHKLYTGDPGDFRHFDSGQIFNPLPSDICNAKVNEVIKKATSFFPRDRYASCEEFIKEIKSNI